MVINTNNPIDLLNNPIYKIGYEEGYKVAKEEAEREMNKALVRLRQLQPFCDCSCTNTTEVIPLTEATIGDLQTLKAKESYPMDEIIRGCDGT